MAQCVAFDGNGFLVAAASSPCTSLVVVTPAEYEVIASNPFRLTEAGGLELGLAITGVWVVAWCMRALYSVLLDRGLEGEP